MRLRRLTMILAGRRGRRPLQDVSIVRRDILDAPLCKAVAMTAHTKKAPLSLSIRDKGAYNLCGTTLVPAKMPTLEKLYRAFPGIHA